jgi:hypothetical protein
MILRLSGAAEQVGTRDGIAKGTNKPYSIPFVSVRVNDFVVTDANLADALVGAISPGDVVDLIVDVDKTQSGFISVRATGHWPSSPALHAAKTG